MTREPNPELERILFGETIDWDTGEKTSTRVTADGEAAEKAFQAGDNLNDIIKGTQTTFQEVSSLAKRHGLLLILSVHYRGVATTRDILVPRHLEFDFWKDLVNTISPPASWRIDRGYIRLHYD